MTCELMGTHSMRIRIHIKTLSVTINRRVIGKKEE